MTAMTRQEAALWAIDEIIPYIRNATYDQYECIYCYRKSLPGKDRIQHARTCHYARARSAIRDPRAPKPTPTKRQAAVLNVIRELTKKMGYSPTLQEIGDILGINKVTVHEHVCALGVKGLLDRGLKNAARSITLAGE